MSQIITLNTRLDGSFDNYFEDTIKIRKESEIALIKSIAVNVKYDSYEYITAPAIDLANKAIQCLRFCCDGVNVALSWEDIFDSYEILGGTATIEAFLSGAFRWSLDPGSPANVADTFSHALSAELEFYDIQPSCEISYSANTGGNPIISKFGIVSNFSTKRLDNSGTLEDITAWDVFLGTATTTDANVEITGDNTVVYSNTDLAINAGMLNFTVKKTDPKYRIGVVAETLDTTGVVGTNADIDYAFAIEVNSNGNGTYDIIRDGISTHVASGFTSGTEDFQIVFSRTNTPEATTDSDYTAFLLQGYPVDSGEEDYQDYIVARHKLKDGYTPSLVIDAPTSGVTITNLSCIKATEQDREARNFKSTIKSPNDLGNGGTVFRNAHSWILRNSDAFSANDRNATAVFFELLGLTNFNSPDITRANEISESFANPDNNRLVIKGKFNAPVLYSQFYYLPQNKSQIDLEQKQPEEPILNSPHPYIQLHLETMNTITFEGNYQKKTERRQQNTATKVIMNIPRGENVVFSSDLYPDTYASYDYEIFNPYYVSLFNTEEIPLNQIKARLTTPDNDIIKLDENINTGNSVIMLHCRRELATK